MSVITGVFPLLPVAKTEQSLVSHAGLNVVTSFVDALGFRELCEDRLGQFVPSGARHRARGRCENRIETLKNTGLGKLPFFDFHANQAWATIATLAMNLVSWLQLAALQTGHKARGWDIKR